MKGVIDFREGKSVGREKLDRIKYVGKNVILPMLGGTALFILSGYIFFGSKTKAWTPGQIKVYDEKQKIIHQMEAEHKSEVNYFYNRMFQYAKTSEDTFKIYSQYNLPFKFLEPTLEQKERAIEKNRLERSLKW